MIKERFSDRFQNILSDDAWVILQDEYNPEENLKYESLFCLTNGYLGTRGSHEEGTITSIPCTYVNGVFDKSETFMRELANLPNWLCLRLYVEKELIGVENCEILEFSRALDMHNACLVKRFHLRDKKGRETLIEGLRYVSRAHVHRMGVKLYVTPLNYDGMIEVENIIDGSVINFCDAPRFKVKHTYLTANRRLADKGAYLEVATRDNDLHIGVGSYLEAVKNGENVIKTTQFGAFGEQAVEFNDFDAVQGETVEVTKYVSIYTGRDVSTEEIPGAVAEEISAFRRQGFEEEFKEHQAVYDKLWQQFPQNGCHDVSSGCGKPFAGGALFQLTADGVGCYEENEQEQTAGNECRAEVNVVVHPRVVHCMEVECDRLQERAYLFSCVSFCRHCG